MAKDMKAKGKEKVLKRKRPKKKRWYSYLLEAYKVAKTSYPWVLYALLGLFFGIILLFVIISLITHHWITWMILGLVLAITLPLVFLTELVKRASYKQIDGKPGAALAVMQQIRRGWSISEEPVRFNVKTQDMIFRAVGRAGVVLVSEGPANRVEKLIKEERQAIKRIAPSAPVSVIKTGNGEGQVPLAKLQRKLSKLPKRISNQEVSALIVRLDAVKTNRIPIPKGIDPTNTRANRRALRG